MSERENTIVTECIMLIERMVSNLAIGHNHSKSQMVGKLRSTNIAGMVEG
jgi:hypothetical protein